MRTATAKVTSKGQITIPAEIRAALAVVPGDRVSFVVEDGRIRVTKSASFAERTAGIFKGRLPGPPPTIEQMKDDAQAAWVDDVLAELED
jgi:antitoxin PrlF